MGEKILRPDQERAIALLRQSLGSGKKRPMIAAPTGFGKTVVAAAIVKGALAKRRRVIFTVPAIELIDQTVERLWEDGIRDVGVLQGSHPLTDYSRQIQVASVQTLARRKIPPADLVLIDEAHRRFDSVSKWMADPDWAKVPFVGLSATPWARGLGKDYDDLLIPTTISELIAAGHLSGFKVFAPSHPDLSGVAIKAGDYDEGQLSTVMQDGKLVADIVSTWLERAEGRPTLVFGVDRAHAKKLQTQFEASGVAAGYVDGWMERDERNKVRDDFRAGRLQVVCNVGVLTTGVDWDVRCIVLARPTRSEMLFVQIIGRGLRTAPGKADCLVLDHSDTHLRLGFVTDIHHTELDDGKATRATPDPVERLPKECPECSYLKPVGVSVCPACGHKPEPRSKLECEAGELVEMNASGKRKKAEPTAEERLRFFAELLGLADERGKLLNWVNAHYRAKFGIWPPREWRHFVAAAEPSGATRSWVRSRAIAFAKSRERAA
jgi:DNA repair protein RadD